MKLVLKNPIFIYILIFKIILAYLFSSQYSSELFLPFLKSISYQNWNPWQSYYEKGMLDSFPYHGLMLLLLTPFAFFGELIGLGEFVIKIPLLIADLIILIILFRLIPNNENKILFFYFSNHINSQTRVRWSPSTRLSVALFYLPKPARGV